MTYQLPSAGVTWSTVFRQLESNKQRLGIVDYSVSQTTLDQVSMSHDCIVMLPTLQTIMGIPQSLILITGIPSFSEGSFTVHGKLMIE